MLKVNVNYTQVFCQGPSVVRVYLKYFKLGHCTKASKSHSDKRVKRIFLRDKSQRILLGELALNYPLSKEVKGIHLEQPLLKRKPGELLKLISRLGSLDSDDYKGKIAD